MICYHSRRYKLETSVILSLGKCALIVTRPHLFHSSPIVRTFKRSFFPLFYSHFILHDHIYSIQVQSLEPLNVVFFLFSIVILYYMKQLTAYNTSDNFLQISCCEFEYFSTNKRYTSRRRQRNERTKSQNELAWTYSAFIHENIDIHNRVRTPEKCSPWIYLPFSKQSIEAIARGSTSLVWQLLSYEELYLLPWIWIRLWLSY